MKKIFLPLALIATITFSCKKDKDEAKQVEVTKENLIGTYKLKSQESKLNGIPYTPQTEACLKDDLYILKATNVFEYKDAGVICDPDESYDGTWELQGKVITTDSDLEGTISSFTGTELVVEDSGTEQGISWSVKLVLTKQ